MGKTILLANDDVAYAAQIEAWLTERGFSVIVDDEASAASSTHQKLDYIVFDFDGSTTEEQMQQLQNMQLGHCPPVMILTRYPDPRLPQRTATLSPTPTCVAKAECSPRRIGQLISQHVSSYTVAA